MDHRAGVRPGRGAGLLLFLRAEPLQAAHHLAPHAQTHHHAARRARTPRRPRHPAPLPAARLTAAQYAALRTALRQPHHALHRRQVEDGGAACGDRPGEAPHPHPVLHLLRRHNGLPPARRAGRESPARGRGAHPLRRRGVQRREKVLFRGDAPRGNRGVRVPARQVPAFHQQGQLPQPPQNSRHRRLRRLHRRHEHRRPSAARNGAHGATPTSGSRAAARRGCRRRS